jgi:tetratricopeptide (TPR) repeat protein
MVSVWMVCAQMILAAAGGSPEVTGWTSRDVGDVALHGSAQHDQGASAWTVRGDGSDIFDNADSFHYAYQRLQGDSSIVAKVESLENTDPWAKSGVMIRESLEPGSRFVGVYATPDYGVCFQARAATADLAVSETAPSQEQQALRAPVWIKLERKGNQFRGYYATDAAGTVWTPMRWKPPTISMFQTVYVGLAVTSHASGTLCEARFSGVAVTGMEGAITEAEILADPRQALANAYQELERLGDWHADGQTIQKHANLIAGSLFAIARARALSGVPAGAVLPDYYRVVQLLPDSSFAVDALIQITILEGTKGLEYALPRLETKPQEDRDRFYLAVMKTYGHASAGPAQEAVMRSFVAHVGESSSFGLLNEVLTDLGYGEQAQPVCKNLIQYSMAQAESRQTAIVGLRYMALKHRAGQEYRRIEELARWAATQFQDAQLVACATAVLADTYYDRGRYAEALEAFQPGLFAADQPQGRIVENLENALQRYRTNTLLQNTLQEEWIYRALADKASGLGLKTVALHCVRKVAESRGLSLESFAQAALPGVKPCDSGPENEIWFWEGLIAAEEGDLGTAAAAYLRFVQGDAGSVLAAKAYYDIARAKMALGEDAREWVTKAKALSPCEAVKRLEQRLGTRVSVPDRK